MLAPVTRVPENDSRTQQTAVYKRAAILLGLCVILAGVASSSELHDALMGVLVVTEGIIGQHPIAGAAAFVVLAAVSVHLGASFVQGCAGLILITGTLIALFSLVTFYALRRTMRDAHSRALQESA
jgi:hypothetical protein